MSITTILAGSVAAVIQAAARIAFPPGRTLGHRRPRTPFAVSGLVTTAGSPPEEDTNQMPCPKFLLKQTRSPCQWIPNIEPAFSDSMVRELPSTETLRSFPLEPNASHLP